MILGCWLILQSIFTIVLWTMYSADYYEAETYKYAVAVLVLDVIFDLLGLYMFMFIFFILFYL